MWRKREPRDEDSKIDRSEEDIRALEDEADKDEDEEARRHAK